VTVKVDWHEDATTAPGSGSGPFDLASSSLVAAGPLTNDFTPAQLREKIVHLFKREKFLFDRMGISCPIKDRCDTSCLACPLNEAADPDSVKGSLCRVGVEQERAETLLAVKLGADGR
jgi:hypothetical protein